MRNETAIKSKFEHKGKLCVILWVRDHFCAYVETKLKIGYSDEEYNYSPEGQIQCHGGVTFSGELDHISEEFNKKWFFGMDFAHAGDYMDFSSYGIHLNEGDHRWTLEEVTEETKTMCDSVIDYEEKYEPRMELKKKHAKELAELKEKQESEKL